MAWIGFSQQTSQQLDIRSAWKCRFPFDCLFEYLINKSHQIQLKTKMRLTPMNPRTTRNWWADIRKHRELFFVVEFDEHEICEATGKIQCCPFCALKGRDMYESHMMFMPLQSGNLQLNSSRFVQCHPCNFGTWVGFTIFCTPLLDVECSLYIQHSNAFSSPIP